MKRIAILGSTGSIGRSTLSIVESFPDRFSVVSMAAGNNVELAFEQARRWRPQILSMANPKAADQLQSKLKQAGLASAIEVTHGSTGTVKVSTHTDADFVVSAIVGVAGLEATYEAVKAGKSMGLANKECLVAAGDLITAEARRQGKPLLPIDSEHNAIHQCMRGGRQQRSAAHLADRFGRSIFSYPGQRFLQDYGGAGAESPDLEDGQAHYHRFGHPDEQRLRGDRSLPSLRYAARPRSACWFIPKARFTPWSSSSMAACLLKSQSRICDCRSYTR